MWVLPFCTSGNYMFISEGYGITSRREVVGIRKDA